VATWRDVSELGTPLPETEESTTYRKPALKVRGKVFAWMSPHADALVLRVEPEERPLMIASQPDVYYTIPHYENYAMVLVRLDVVTDLDDLRDRIAESWSLAAPPVLARRFAGGTETA
jgi:hypothetical protein